METKKESSPLGRFITRMLDRFSGYLADSLLRPRSDLAQQYQFLTAELGTSYGESPFQGTPFVQHISLGGGLCAQAACFMATCLLYEHAGAIQGIPQITHSLAKKLTGRDDLLLFDGLTLPHISDYFSQVRLRGDILGFPTKHTRDRYPGFSFEDWLGKVIRSYVRSGFPVIFPTDPGSLDPMYQRAARSYNPEVAELLASSLRVDPKRFERTLHALVVVGVDKGAGDSFLVNDPRALPFMQISKEELLHALPDFESLSFKRCNFCIPVVPERVNVPLLETISHDRNELHFGLIDAILCCTKNSNARSYCESHQLLNLYNLLESHSQLGEFFLIPPTGDHRGELFERLQELAGLTHDQVSVLGQWLSRPKVSQTWIWLQLIRSSEDDRLSAVFWRAECTDGYSIHSLIPTLYLGQMEAIDGHYLNDNGSADVITKSDTSNSQVASWHVKTHEIDQTTRFPELSLISSFAVDKFQESVRRWPKGIRNCEYYLLMQPDSNNEMDAIKYLSSRSDLPKAQVYSHAQEVLETAIKSPNSCIEQIIGVATYFPNLCFPARDCVSSISSLTYAIRFADALSEIQQRPVVLELVAGSRVHGVVEACLNIPNIPPYSNPFFGIVRSSQHTLQDFVSNLGEALVTASDTFECSLQDVTIAVEAETSNLCVLTSLRSMQDMAVEFRKQLPRFESQLGFNLDIGHWILNGITPAALREYPDVFRRVAHVHLSNQNRVCHFSDLPLLAFSQFQEQYDEWLGVITGKLNATDQIVNFSGFLSIEVEASDDRLLDACVRDSQLVWEGFCSRNFTRKGIS
ncbi:MAG: hypothetical protein KDB03_05020 [Planctomycetales bacterium]|nr:hypothetical protein [Planctomycetales bacterium]